MFQQRDAALLPPKKERKHIGDKLCLFQYCSLGLDVFLLMVVAVLEVNIYTLSNSIKKYDKSAFEDAGLSCAADNPGIVDDYTPGNLCNGGDVKKAYQSIHFPCLVVLNNYCQTANEIEVSNKAANYLFYIAIGLTVAIGTTAIVRRCREKNEEEALSLNRPHI